MVWFYSSICTPQGHRGHTCNLTLLQGKSQMLLMAGWMEQGTIV